MYITYGILNQIFKVQVKKKSENDIANIKKTHSFVTKTKTYLKITHMGRRRGTTQNCLLAFTDELEKQIFIKKTVEVGQ